MRRKFRRTQLLLTALSLAVYSTFATAALTLPTQSVTIAPMSSQTPVLDSYLGTVTTATQIDTGYASATDSQFLTFSKFSASTGVLTGVTWGLSSLSGTVTLHGAATSTGTTNNKFDARGYVTASIAGVSFGTDWNSSLSYPTSPRLSCGSSIVCFGSGYTSGSSLVNPDTTASQWKNFSGVNAADNTRDNYVGTDPFQAELRVTRSVHLERSATGVGTLNITNPSISMNLANFTGTQSLTYSYLKHANASFTAGTDTNQLIAQVTDLPLSFSVFNLGDANTTKLDNVSVNCVGDCNDFQLTLPSIQDLMAGGSGITGSVTRIGDDAGSATYTLMFADDTAIGASASRLQNSLSVSVAAVPEPAEWTMLIAGLLVVGFIARRRREFRFE